MLTLEWAAPVLTLWDILPKTDMFRECAVHCIVFLLLFRIALSNCSENFQTITPAIARVPYVEECDDEAPRGSVMVRGMMSLI